MSQKTKKRIQKAEHKRSKLLLKRQRQAEKGAVTGRSSPLDQTYPSTNQTPFSDELGSSQSSDSAGSEEAPQDILQPDPKFLRKRPQQVFPKPMSRLASRPQNPAFSSSERHGHDRVSPEERGADSPMGRLRSICLQNEPSGGTTNGHRQPCLGLDSAWERPSYANGHIIGNSTPNCSPDNERDFPFPSPQIDFFPNRNETLPFEESFDRDPNQDLILPLPSMSAQVLPNDILDNRRVHYQIDEIGDSSSENLSEIAGLSSLSHHSETGSKFSRGYPPP